MLKVFANTDMSECSIAASHQGVRGKQMEGNWSEGWKASEGRFLHLGFHVSSDDARLASNMRRSTLVERFDTYGTLFQAFRFAF